MQDRRHVPEHALGPGAHRVDPFDDARIEPGAGGPIFESLVVHGSTPLSPGDDGFRLDVRGEDGALFPWRTINGEEASAYYAAGTAQYHINAAVVFALAGLSTLKLR